MKIGTKITLGIGSMALMLAVSCAMAWTLTSQQIGSTVDQQRALQLTAAVKQYQLDAAGVAVAANSIAYDFTSHSDPSADQQSFTQSTNAAQSDAAALVPLMSSTAERANLDHATIALSNYVSQTDQIIADFQAGTPATVQAANNGVAALAYHTVTTPLGQLERQIRTQSKLTLDAALARGQDDRLLVVGLMLAALVLATVVGVAVTRSITIRLRNTAKVLDQVAAGDMSKRIEVDSTDEVGQMASSLNLALDGAEERDRAQRFESRLANALDMAAGEPEVLGVVERSFAATVPDSPIELLLADNSHAHLRRMAVASPTGRAPGCAVDSPDGCPAARRAQVQHFTDSQALDACPRLLDRNDGPCQAVCVPVSIMGRTVGVIHTTSAMGIPFPEHQVSDLETLAKLAGARIGLLRVMSETQLQASTDTLTGLLNRRSFEQKVKAMRADGTPTSIVMADLDHFKDLNDTYGHPTGDRALVLFAKTLQNSLRTGDVIGRHGGEEFVIALPDCSAADARTTLDTLRADLEAAITVAGVPLFTASFGVVDAHDDEDLPQAIDRADAALFLAKSEGRNRVVIGQGDPSCPSEEHEGRRLRTSIFGPIDARTDATSEPKDSATLVDAEVVIP